jgi:predicted site-specific integrase-resolvase
MNEKLYKVSEVAELFEVTPATVRLWLNEGILYGVKIGKGYYWRIPQSSIENLATERWGSENQNA